MTPVCTSATDVPAHDRATWFTTRAQIALAACTCGGVSAFVYAVDPNRYAVYPQCMLYNATGIYCAGCGATRAFYALLHGRVLDALHDNALFVAALPVLLYVAGSYALTAWRANAWPAIHVDGRKMATWGISVFLFMIAFMIFRNQSGPVADWLKPLAVGS